MRQFIACGFLLLLIVGCVYSLDRSKKLTSLRVGILKRIPKDQCTKIVEREDAIEVTYTGRLLKDDTEFDSNVGKAPFNVDVGAGRVIQGWEKGLLGYVDDSMEFLKQLALMYSTNSFLFPLYRMCIGEKRRIFIPSELGYGSAGSPPKIPENADLVFDVEVLKITKFGQSDEL